MPFIRGLDRAGHGWICGFLVGNGIYVVALNFLNILHFFHVNPSRID